MSFMKKPIEYLRQKKGDSAVSFIVTVTMLILFVAVLISSLVYVAQYYSASFICRRVVRSIEIMGEYDESTIAALVDSLGGGALDDLDVTVDATYFRGKKIQLWRPFTVQLSAVYQVHILMLGEETITLDLPIEIEMTGRSEVFWK